MIEQKIEVVPVACKNCGSNAVYKFGTYKGTQLYMCKSCKRKFADNKALPRMRTPTDQISDALNMHYEGMSLNAIKRNLKQQNNYDVSDVAIYKWIDRFTDDAVRETRDLHPKVGDVWVADETVLDIDGKNVWFWDIIDAKTRFLLASHVSFTRTTKDAESLMRKAAKRAGKTPKQVLTDKLASYLDGIEVVFGGDTEHVRSKGFTVQPNTNLIERFHGTLKDRTKVMRGLKNIESAIEFTDGWLVHYNFLRPHSALDDKTPAEEAGLKSPYKNWADVVNAGKPQSRAVQIVDLRRSPRMSQTPQTRFAPRTPKVRTPQRGYIIHPDGRRERQKRGTVI
jgi:transposase-like protein